MLRAGEAQEEGDDGDDIEERMEGALKHQAPEDEEQEQTESELNPEVRTQGDKVLGHAQEEVLGPCL